METSELDSLRNAYKDAVDEWVAAIRHEEDLATPDHSMVAWEQWDQAVFVELDAQKKAKEARDRYKDALREIHYSF